MGRRAVGFVVLALLSHTDVETRALLLIGYFADVSHIFGGRGGPWIGLSTAITK